MRVAFAVAASVLAASAHAQRQLTVADEVSGASFARRVCGVAGPCTAIDSDTDTAAWQQCCHQDHDRR